MATKKKTNASLPEVGDEKGAQGAMSVLGSAHCTIQGMGITFGEGINLVEWTEAGQRLAEVSKVSLFCLGDWLNYGAETFPKDYEKAVEVTGMAIGTLRNIASVAKKYPLDTRRPSLSFEHHRLAASMPEQERGDLLERAEEQKLTTAALNNLVPRSRSGKSEKAEFAAHMKKWGEVLDYLEKIPRHLVKAAWDFQRPDEAHTLSSECLEYMSRLRSIYDAIVSEEEAEVAAKKALEETRAELANEKKTTKK